MNQHNKARAFADLHRKGWPLVLFNVWDAGSARAVAEAGAKAVATGSWSVAAANGFSDGEELPLELALANAARIVASVDLPVTIDFEGGYAEEPAGAAENVVRLIETGAVGCNFEDQIVRGSGIYPMEKQCARIAAIREAAEQAGVSFFINARTDLFLHAEAAEHTGYLEEAIARAKAYGEAGGSGFFAPGLADLELIRRLSEASPLPVNIMMFLGVPTALELAALGVSRISHGPGPYRQAMEHLKAAARAAFSG